MARKVKREPRSQVGAIVRDHRRGPPREPITVIAWASAIAHAIEAGGGSSEEVFRRAGIPYAAASDPEALLPTRQINLLFELGAEEVDDPAFGLRVAAQVHSGSFHALGYWLFSSPSLGVFCTRLHDFFELHSDNVKHEIQDIGDACRLLVVPTNPEITPHAYEAWLGSLVFFCRMLQRPNFCPQRVYFRHSLTAASLKKHQQFFRCSIDTNAQHYALEFYNEDMRVALRPSTFSLARRNEELVIEYLSRLHREDTVSRTQAVMVKLLPLGQCSRARVAHELCLTPRTLHNRLRAHGATYQSTLDAVRQRLALAYIASPDLPMMEVASYLGFTSNASFTHAFRRWTGCSPTEFRTQITQQIDSQ
jgi:AraC-like DNA-binding protein